MLNVCFYVFLFQEYNEYPSRYFVICLYIQLTEQCILRNRTIGSKDLCVVFLICRHIPTDCHLFEVVPIYSVP